MTYENLNFEVDTDGIALLSIDVNGKTMNVYTLGFIEELEQAVDRFLEDEAIKGMVITSAKDNAFMAGADLTMIASIPEDATIEQKFEASFRVQKLFRKLETGGQTGKDLQKGATTKPVAIAIHGVALGGGMEMALACHYRILSDDSKTKIGQPEVKVGLIPGWGGTQRVLRLAGVQPALQICTQGNELDANAAKAQNLIHDIAPKTEIVAKAKQWCRDNPKVSQPWDKKGFKIPGGAGAMDPRVVPIFAGASAMAQGTTNHNYPAVRRILSCVYEGSIVPMDVGIRIESKYFTQGLQDSQARNMIRTLFINKGAAEKGMARPEGVEKTQAKRLGVLGAGMMGAGIAYVAARAGIDVLLLDRDMEAAEKGKSYTEKLNQKGVQRGKITKEKADAILERITPITDYAALSDVDLIIEAVFEDPGVKADVIKKTEAVIGEDVVFATNTSTIPIGNLAKNSERADQFIGIHFFSPVDKMPLVEIIPHGDTGERALATALDFVAQIKKTPIVVADARGFYCNSVVVPYLNEAALMVKEGINPALIDNVAVQMGMPVGPLALMDETSQELGLSITRSAMAEEGENYQPTGVEGLLELFVETLGRKGKKVGKGFYEYPEDGSKKFLWPGLSEHFPLAPEQPTAEEVEERLMYVQLVAAAQLFAQDVVHDPESADIGAIFGWGFCPWTGGPMSHIDSIGLRTFVETADRLAETHGEKFRAPQMFRDLAARNGELYEGRSSAAA